MEAAIVAIAVLACPVGMGAMMWFMARGKKDKDQVPGTLERDASLDQLREEQARLDAQIVRLERDRRDGATTAS